MESSWMEDKEGGRDDEGRGKRERERAGNKEAEKEAVRPTDDGS